MPALVFVLLNAFTAAIQAAPQVTELVQKSKDYFGTLVKGGVITEEQQNAIHARVDAISEAALAGKFPDSWEVEPDPV